MTGFAHLKLGERHRTPQRQGDTVLTRSVTFLTLTQLD